MTEENLKNLALQDLHNEMVKAIQELAMLNSGGADPGAYTRKKEEIKLIHALIESKKRVHEEH